MVGLALSFLFASMLLAQDAPKIEDSLYVAIESFDFVERSGVMDLDMITTLYRKPIDDSVYASKWYKDTSDTELTIMIASTTDSTFTSVRDVMKRKFRTGQKNEFTLRDVPVGTKFWISIDIQGQHKRFVTDAYHPDLSHDPENSLLHRYPILIMSFIAFIAFLAGFLVSRKEKD